MTDVYLGTKSTALRCYQYAQSFLLTPEERIDYIQSEIENAVRVGIDHALQGNTVNVDPRVHEEGTKTL